MSIAVHQIQQAMARFTILGKCGFPSRQRGFGYLAVLFIAIMLGIMAGTTYEQLETVMRRDKEREWLFVGKQYQQAIASYYHQSPNGLKELPNSLDDLVSDGRFLRPMHHLRKRYIDPVTGADWLLLKNEQGRISGVVSSSNAPILQSALVESMAESTATTEGKAAVMTYAEIKYEFLPQSGPPKNDALSEDENNEVQQNLNDELPLAE